MEIVSQQKLCCFILVINTSSAKENNKLEQGNWDYQAAIDKVIDT